MGGLPGNLVEQYEVDVSAAQGIALKPGEEKDGSWDGSWEVFFCSDLRRDVLAYKFRFVTGFELHRRCRDSSYARHSVHARGALLLVLTSWLCTALWWW